MRALFEAVRNWQAAYAASHALAQHRAGYNWAAGELLRGASMEQVIHHVDNAEAFDLVPVAYHSGAHAACTAWGLL